ncbi:decaprenyl-phosphate phosphoribosyltransferase [Lujinxingia litoralis]|uniref:decaprenyl-phosphate phosphoribosyltransferase n=1 Tax=Lujinxingia litoralis TaxID=2211119 RepID=UPI001314B020|nr:decaprenyl-phosphate phosphoribosyltransferase [Lujinxingia litoralis]
MPEQNPSAAAVAQHVNEAVEPRPWRGLWKSLRPHQWVKNAFVLAPLFFAKAYTDPLLAGKALAAALLYSLAAGTVYVLNDLMDVERDREHPIKRHRPIASGELPEATAWRALVVIGGSASIASYLLSPLFAAVVGTYLVMNLAYSIRLKHYAFVDVAIIATGFVLRVLAGAAAVSVMVSEWLIACTFLLALYLGLGKRRHELALYLSGTVERTRRVLDSYRLENVDFGMLVTSGLTTAAYTIYTLTASLPDQPLRTVSTPFASIWLPVTIPMVVVGLARFFQIVRRDDARSPTEMMLRDKPFVLNIALWGVVMLVLSVL